MNIHELLNSDANVSITVSLNDVKEFADHILNGIRQMGEEREKPATDETYLTVEEVEQMLGVAKSTLWRWDKAGHLKRIKVGEGVVRYRKSDVLKLVEGK